MRCIKLEKALVWCCWVGNWKLRKKMIFFSCPMIDHLLQGVPTSLEYVCKQYELRLPKNMYFAPKNCFFSLFCELQKWKWLFKAFFFSIYLINYCIRIICFKKPFSFLQFTKKAEKAVFWSKKKSYNFIGNISELENLFQTCWDTLYVASSCDLVGWCSIRFISSLMWSV